MTKLANEVGKNVKIHIFNREEQNFDEGSATRKRNIFAIDRGLIANQLGTLFHLRSTEFGTNH